MEETRFLRSRCCDASEIDGILLRNSSDGRSLLRETRSLNDKTLRDMMQESWRILAITWHQQNWAFLGNTCRALLLPEVSGEFKIESVLAVQLPLNPINHDRLEAVAL